MSKHTPEELKAMAIRTLQARDDGDIRYLELIMNLAVRANMSPADCERKIQELAQ